MTTCYNFQMSVKITLQPQKIKARGRTEIHSPFLNKPCQLTGQAESLCLISGYELGLTKNNKHLSNNQILAMLCLANNFTYPMKNTLYHIYMPAISI